MTVVLLWALLRMLDLVALRNLFLDLPVWFYFLPLAVILGGQVAYAWRWRLLLRASGVSVPFTVVIRQYSSESSSTTFCHRRLGATPQRSSSWAATTDTPGCRVSCDLPSLHDPPIRYS